MKKYKISFDELDSSAFPFKIKILWLFPSESRQKNPIWFAENNSMKRTLCEM